MPVPVKHPLELVSASSVPISALVSLLNEVFSDYAIPIEETVEEFSVRAKYNDISLEDSLIARTEGKSVGLVLLGLRGKEAWIGGMGVKKEYRGQGVGKTLVEQILENARKRGAASISLEVMVGNEPAYNTYRGFGFADVRSLSCYNRNDWKTNGIEDAVFQPVEFSELEGIYDKEHCWQKTFSSLAGVKNLECYAVEYENVNGYLVLARREKRVELVDIKPEGVLTTALSMFAGEKEEIRAINIHAKSLREALSQAGFTEFTRQREMRLAL